MGVTIPKKFEKYALYAGGAVALYLVYKLATRGVGGTARDITSGIVGGAFDAVGGAVSGVYDGLPEAVKPSSNQNIIYRGVNGIGSTISGNDSWTLGGWIYDITH